MRRISFAVRWGALLSAGALGLHEVQYRATFGARADVALEAHGHAYLSWALALATALCALALARLAVEVGAARRDGRMAAGPRRPSLRRRWAWSSTTLVLTYLLQEGMEGALAAGHPGLLHALGSHNGWLVLLLAGVLGAVVASLLRGAEAIVGAARAGARAPRPRRPAPARPLAPTGVRPPRSVLAAHLAGRGPPRLLAV